MNTTRQLTLLMAVLWTIPASAFGDSVFERIQRATVRIVSGQDRSSGVIVSQTGDVLTVAHGLNQNSATVNVVLHDGTQVEASVRKLDTKHDVALLKIRTTSSPLPQPVPIRTSSKPARADWVMAAGCPGREASGLSAVVRLGQVLAVTDTAIRSSCMLTAGDSGGPLIDTDGYLIGLNRRIGPASVQNLHIPIAVCLTLMDADSTATGNPPDPLNDDNPLPLMPPPATVVSTLSSHSVRLSYPSSTTDSETQPKTAAGTLIGKGRIVSKLSLAGSATSATVSVDQPGDDVRRQQATLIAADRSLDLALWQTETIIGPLERPAPASDAGPGQIVYAAGKEPRLGIISRIEHTEPQVTPQLGLRLDQLPDDRLIVRRVSPSSASSDAGILEQDLLLSLGDRVVSQLADIRPVLVNYQPGDWISFRCQREDTQPVLSFGQLRHDPASLLLRSEFLDGNSGLLSQRRTGFAAVIQHDIAILAADCGGPLISPSGQLVAINIARRGRESTLAIPIATVIRFAESHLSR